MSDIRYPELIHSNLISALAGLQKLLAEQKIIQPGLLNGAMQMNHGWFCVCGRMIRELWHGLTQLLQLHHLTGCEQKILNTVGCIQMIFSVETKDKTRNNNT